MKKQMAVIKILLSVMILLLSVVTYIGYRYYVSAHQKPAFFKPIVSTETITSGSNQPDSVQHSNNTKSTSAAPSKKALNTKPAEASNKKAAKSDTSHSNQNKNSNTKTKPNQPTANKQPSKPLTVQEALEKNQKQSGKQAAGTKQENSNTNVVQPADPKDAVVPTIGITAPTAPTSPVIQAPKP
ncbi:hypothetical protein [Heyndrickxia acidicola]|uniref:Uncharacterized protein n=1 Tax=Heyndrickxia acidicola TaxID=209389 RepID=A0ABU6MMW5_9BACI|nr:hypothetical protein [Heyndrickxia acidicola]MED1206036.1 hypothetical protein [Heyndrickxia acidicola]